VTGGGSGLGLVTAAALAQNGCKVYITGRRGDVLEQAAKDATPGPETGGEVIPIQADVSDKEGIDSEHAALQHFSPRLTFACLPELKAEISKREKFLNVLINSKSTSPIFFPLFLKNELMPSIDHGVSLGAPPIVSICCIFL
jgi:NAD(P)-dependent dehydrogenase (short-subunit alcohol dehydrogenase family)